MNQINCKRRRYILFSYQVHRLGGSGTWNAGVRKIAEKSQIVVGFTGTLFTTHLEFSAAQVCSALGLDEELHQEAFWSQEAALSLALSKSRGIYHPPDAVVHSEASSRPPNPEWRFVDYANTPISFSERASPTIRAICDCMDISEAEALQFHGCETMMDKKKCLDVIMSGGSASSKLIVLYEAIRALFSERRYKILVSVYYLDVLLIVQEYLHLRFRNDQSVKILEFSGNFNQAARASSLASFLGCSSRKETKSILIVTVASAKNGLNLTNGIDSPTAHVEFEYPASATDRFQMQCRIDREGNPHAVQLVVLTGRETVNGNILGRHVRQAQKRKRAGDEVPQKFLDTDRDQRTGMSRFKLEDRGWGERPGERCSVKVENKQTTVCDMLTSYGRESREDVQTS